MKICETGDFWRKSFSVCLRRRERDADLSGTVWDVISDFAASLSLSYIEECCSFEKVPNSRGRQLLEKILVLKRESDACDSGIKEAAGIGERGRKCLLDLAVDWQIPGVYREGGRTEVNPVGFEAEHFVEVNMGELKKRKRRGGNLSLPLFEVFRGVVCCAFGEEEENLERVLVDLMRWDESLYLGTNSHRGRILRSREKRMGIKALE